MVKEVIDMNTLHSKLYVIPLGPQMTPVERERLLPYIPAEKRARIGAFRQWQDAQRTVLGYSLLSHLLAAETGERRESLKLVFDYYGKPHWPGSGLHFNLSHSGEWIACGLARTPIGVDVEKVQPIDLEIADNFFAPSEVADLRSLPQEKQQEYFFTLWSLKESYIKAEGLGVSIPLHSFWFKALQGGEIHFGSNKGDDRWHFQLYPFDQQYKLAVCVDKQVTLPEKVQLINRETIV